MTKWKCERCKDKCGFACDDDDLPVRCQLSWYGVFPYWHKVETVEEWLDLELGEEKNCLDCIHYPNCDPTDATCYECLDTREMTGFSPKFSPKAKPEHEHQWITSDGDTYCVKCGKISKPDTSDGIEGYELKERIELLEHWDAKNTEDIDDMKERIEKLEEQAHNHPDLVRLLKALNDDIEELKNQMRSLSMHSHPTVGMEMERMNEEIEQLKKKAHEHPFDPNPCTYPCGGTSYTGATCVHVYYNGWCIRCGRRME